MKCKLQVFVFAFSCIISHGFAQTTNEKKDNFLDLNKPERLEWLKDAGFGMFIHFSFDSQLGIVISHSMAGASQDYLNRFINELPKTFNPRDFSGEDIAILAKLAGMKYMVLPLGYRNNSVQHHEYTLWQRPGARICGCL